MTDADKPGEATSRRRSLLVEQLAELERVLDGIELDPERKSMLRAAGYRTCVGIAWQAAKHPPSAETGAPAAPVPASSPPLPPQTPGGPPMMPPPAQNSPTRVPASPEAGTCAPAGPWALHVKQQLESKQLSNASYAALCKLMGLEKGSGKYPSGEDCLLLTEIEACNIAQAQPRKKQGNGGGRWR